MSYISDIFIQKQSALIRLQNLNNSMSGVSDTLNIFKSLSDQGILPKSTTDVLVSNYKNQLLDYVNNEINLANQEGTMYANAASIEVLDKVKGIAPLMVAGSPVITSPDPVTAETEETAFLAQVPSLTNDLTTLLNNINTILI